MPSPAGLGNSSHAPIAVRLTGGESRAYPIMAQAGLLSQLGHACRQLGALGTKVLILTDTNLQNRYLSQVQDSLQQAGFEVTSLVLDAGERSKSLDQAQGVYQTLIQQGFTRKDTLLGLGGGVIGDLSGFCASTYHRGMALIHVPTTLVAQVDSAIGGKTAVNLGQIKNMVGTFYQPKAVFTDTDTLNSLPPREFVAGMAEVIKYGLIETSCDGQTGFFEWLEAHASDLQAGLPAMIHRCAAIKAAVVMADELETRGLRFFLNLGHTFGHAYETLSEYGILHGEAVAIGMRLAVRLSVALGLVDATLLQRLDALYQQVGLSAIVQNAPRFPATEVLAVMKHDKKNQDGGIKLILPHQTIGQVIVRDDIPDAAILSILSNETSP
ncbi:3-dehydroquinate synthase [Vampirovibrio chlorellavorus]|uniref:3-dehydroquinate synthase n=1 Tax=Vampirovibrio chlorellavorus TaxID=758823 RepID=UPI0026F0D5B7|nr:3-dehydroquinate synthase [Vampirovibrio chlorellavorus]